MSSIVLSTVIVVLYSWEYKTTITVDKTILNKQNIELCFKGLDTFSEIYLNDQHVLTTDNMFCEWNTSVKQILVEGDNTLRILFHSPVVMGLLSRDKFNIESPIGYNLEFVANSDWPTVGLISEKQPICLDGIRGRNLLQAVSGGQCFLKAWDNARRYSYADSAGFNYINESLPLTTVVTIEAASDLNGVLGSFLCTQW